ncbi:MAG: aminoacetone oxidase family FAD-binding enzyme [Planctomycetia bacterium]|nr:aminoacetone oxidase family FAD-binding enzyme [Planctomycetia bacterium]
MHSTVRSDTADILVIGAGAAGLFAATWAGRTASAAGRPLDLVAVDGARKLGAKILVAGGGRCNITHHAVDEADYAGATPPAIRKVLRRFDVADTTSFFREAGVEFYREADTGKLFPVTDSSRTVLDALVRETRAAGGRLVHPARVTGIARNDAGFTATTDAGAFHARRVILCTGGKSLPKSGSDGGGFVLARSLGHSLTDPIVPALVPLLLPGGHWITSLSGLALAATLTLRSGTGKRIFATTGSTLCTHLGLSGPAVLDVSRHWLVAQHADPEATLSINWLPGESEESIDHLLLEGQRRGALAVLRERLTERLGRCLCAAAAAPCSGDLTRDARKALATLVTATPLRITGDRGFTVAEATAGGVPLTEVRLETMESRLCQGLHFAGELLDVDGRIGGFNFQWAWASGFVAGTAAAQAVLQSAAGENAGETDSAARDTIS